MVILPGRRIGAIDDLGIDRGLDGFEHGFAGAFGGEIDGARAVEVEVDAGLLRGDERQHDHLDAAAGQVMGGEIVDRHIQPGFDGGDARVHDHADRHAAQAQGDQLGEGDAGAGEQRANPDAEEVHQHDENDQGHDSDHAVPDQLECT